MGKPNHPPFEPGNDAATTHGAFSDRRVVPIARGHETAMLAERDMGLLRSVSRSISTTEARVELIREWLKGKGELDGRGKPRAAAEHLTRLERLLDSQRTSAAKLIASAIDSRKDLASLLVIEEEGKGA